MTYDVERVAASLGIEFFYQRGEEVNGLCPMHEARTGKEDHKPSWWLNISTGMHLCFSCGYRGNLYTLVRDLKELDHASIVAYLKEHTEEESPEGLMKKFRDLPQYVSPAEAEPVSEANLVVYSEPPESELRKRFLTAKAAKDYGVLWDTNKGAWILPIRDPDTGSLWGWQEKSASGRFFRNCPNGVKMSKTVFGVERIDAGTLVVVESPLDAVRIHSLEIAETAVATYGASFSEAQVKIMRRADVVIAAFDNPYLDPAGKKASEQMAAYARKYGIVLRFFNYRGLDAKDPGDMTDQQVRHGIATCLDAILGEKAYC